MPGEAQVGLVEGLVAKPLDPFGDRMLGRLGEVENPGRRSR
jgi:hypothetical protein